VGEELNKNGNSIQNCCNIFMRKTYIFLAFAFGERGHKGHEGPPSAQGKNGNKIQIA